MQLAGALNWVDAALLAFMVASIMFGYLRGFIRTVVGLCSYLVAMVVAGRYAAPALEWIDGHLGLTARLGAVFRQYVHLPADIAAAPIANVPLEAVRTQLDQLPLPPSYRTALVQQMVGTLGADPARSFADWLTNQMVAGVLKAVTFLLLVVAMVWVLHILARAVSGLLDAIPLAGGLNRLLGAATGGIVAALTAALILGLSAPLLSLPGVSALAAEIGTAATAPHFLGLYDWLGNWLFGQAGRFFLGQV